MKVLLVLLPIFAITLAENYDLEFRWSSFKLTHDKTYNSYEEEQLRKQIFATNLKRIEEHNALYEAGVVTHFLGVNQFADMSDEEFEQFLGFSGPPPALVENITIFKPSRELEVPSRFDYRDRPNIINPPRNQGACGSCWAFSALNALESVYALKTGRLLTLSPQNLVDCATGQYNNHGCGGGNTVGAYKYIFNEGIEQEADYPYRAVQSTCRFNPSRSVLRLRNAFLVKKPESNMQIALTQIGPLAVLVDAKEWKLYRGGVFTPSQPFKKITHAVTVVGYGDANGQAYWAIKNSWSSGWGEGGYIRIARNIDAFGVTIQPIVPVV